MRRSYARRKDRKAEETERNERKQKRQEKADILFGTGATGLPECISFIPQELEQATETPEQATEQQLKLTAY